jgi:IS30 family transposase
MGGCGKNIRRIQVVDATVTDAKVKEGRRRLSMGTNKTDRTCLASEQRAEIWRKWQAGELVVRIAKALNRPYSTVHQQICVRGGCAPYHRRGNPRALSLGEREEISRGISAGHSIRQIAERLQRAASTVSREIARHGGRSSYRAARAERAAWRNGQRPKPCKLAVNTRLRAYVASKLALQWSPEQIAHDLAEHFATDNSMQVSHETIYRSLFIQARGALKRELLAHLRSGRRMRQARKSTKAGQGQILEAVSIRERPAQATDRAVPGHWEGDLLCGGNTSQIATLVERHSRFVMLVKLSAKDSTTVVNALSTQMRRLPTQLRRSLTWDRGHELAEHKRFSCATDIQVYFCDPHSPWQRGSNENTNGLLRQYFPKGASLSGYSQADLNRIALRLNTRPRKTLGFRTPADKFNDAVASTT